MEMLAFLSSFERMNGVKEEVGYRKSMSFKTLSTFFSPEHHADDPDNLVVQVLLEDGREVLLDVASHILDSVHLPEKAISNS